MRSATMTPRVQGLGLVGPQALGHRAWLYVLLGLRNWPRQAPIPIQNPGTAMGPLWHTRQRWDFTGQLWPGRGMQFPGKLRPWVLGIALGNITAGQIFQSRNQFRCHSNHPPLPTKHPLSVDNTGPPLPLTTRVIMTLPLILGYKYEKPRKNGGLGKFWKKLRVGMRKYQPNAVTVEGKSKII